jgi:hypothetical protein
MSERLAWFFFFHNTRVGNWAMSGSGEIMALDDSIEHVYEAGSARLKDVLRVVMDVEQG